MLPTTAQGIYDRLQADAALMALVGVYALVDGTTMPAMAVLSANEKLPPETGIDGIEVVITGVSAYAPQPMLTFETLLRPSWRIYVVAYSSTTNLQAATERILTLLPGATAVGVPGDAPGMGIGVLDQQVVSWINPVYAVSAEV